MERRYDHLVRLRPRPAQRYVSQGRTVLATGTDGFIDGGPERGLFVHETRMLSRYGYLIDGVTPEPVALSNVAEHTWLGYYICPPPGRGPYEADQGSGQVQPASQQTVELRLSRFVGGGLHEDVDVTNFTQRALSFTLEIELDADFADQEETRGERKQHGTLTREWRDGRELLFRYEAENTFEHHGRRGHARLERALAVRVTESHSPPTFEEGRLRFRLDLAPAQSWHACIDFVPRVEIGPLLPNYGCRSFQPTSNEHDRAREAFLAEASFVTAPADDTLTPVVTAALDQARRDLASLRLHDLDRRVDAWTIAAGLPLYVALFGRDTLTASWEAALLGPEMMQGTLEVLAGMQGRELDDWRDEQPGRMLHEAHTGPLAVLGVNPRARYYGSVTTSGFYPVVVSELWHWTGDETRVRPLVGPALEALRWLDRECPRMPEGFYAYLTRSEQGVRHQAWKDSGDAIVSEDGSQVDPPIATCEEQAFVYVAKLHLSETLWWLGEKDQAKRLFHEASELKKRFNDAFWLDEGLFAMGLDAQSRPIRSIGSNAGHCLAAGIAERDRAERCAARLLSDDLFSGWGIRTLSSRHPAYNPYSYHRGSVWPVEQGSFALGFLRYGLHHHLHALCRAQFEAARLFEHYRLPEVFSGHARDEDHPFPALYPQANSPQAWSASAVFCFLQAMLGLYPYAPLNMLLLDPHLPDWLPEITLHRLRVGRAVVTLRFRREGERTEYRILKQDGALHVVRQPSPWSLTAGFGERVKDALSSLLPAR
jgi:glycogen debranching enzyme